MIGIKVYDFFLKPLTTFLKLNMVTVHLLAKMQTAEQPFAPPCVSGFKAGHTHSYRMSLPQWSVWRRLGQVQPTLIRVAWDTKRSQTRDPRLEYVDHLMLQSKLVLSNFWLAI